MVDQAGLRTFIGDTCSIRSTFLPVEDLGTNPKTIGPDISCALTLSVKVLFSFFSYVYPLGCRLDEVAHWSHEILVMSQLLCTDEFLDLLLDRMQLDDVHYRFNSPVWDFFYGKARDPPLELLQYLISTVPGNGVPKISAESLWMDIRDRRDYFKQLHGVSLEDLCRRDCASCSLRDDQLPVLPYESNQIGGY